MEPPPSSPHRLHARDPEPRQEGGQLRLSRGGAPSWGEAEFAAGAPSPQPAARGTLGSAARRPPGAPGGPAGLPRARRRRREPAPGRGSGGWGARARPGEGEGHGAVTWARAVASRVRSPAAARPRARRASRFPPRPAALLGPGCEASQPGRPSSAPRGPGRLELPGRPAPGGLSRGAPGSPPPLPPRGRPGRRGEDGRASRGERAGQNAGSATRAAPLPQRRRRPGPCCCCQLVERTLSMRARRPHPAPNLALAQRTVGTRAIEGLAGGLRGLRPRGAPVHRGARELRFALCISFVR
ncbi:translation initiation factor IF-2 [Oryctolagus cuniculus]|uniref:translation initiation factor IF-2 n=1 Tax=Oryctolagus cuniculus TaxID=9986 RepID=UPI003879EE00